MTTSCSSELVFTVENTAPGSRSGVKLPSSVEIL